MFLPWHELVDSRSIYYTIYPTIIYIYAFHTFELLHKIKKTKTNKIKSRRS